jgi:hypothetical protein
MDEAAILPKEGAGISRNCEMDEHGEAVAVFKAVEN